jgi:hypothetical protein
MRGPEGFEQPEEAEMQGESATILAARAFAEKEYGKSDLELVTEEADADGNLVAIHFREPGREVDSFHPEELIRVEPDGDSWRAIRMVHKRSFNEALGRPHHPDAA